MNATSNIASLFDPEADEALECYVEIDPITQEVCKPFDYTFSEKQVFALPYFNAPPRDGSWQVGLIVGPSGSGKTQLLRRHYGETKFLPWNANKTIASHFDTAQDAISRLTGVGLNSVPSWCKPFNVLSNGEQFRATIARSISSNTSFDEFTSVVDRNVAKSAARSISRMIYANNWTGVVFSTCHHDILDWLNPDWVYDTFEKTFEKRRSLRQPPIKVDLYECEPSKWKAFSQHHYLTGSINRASRCWIAKWGEVEVGFVSALAFPNANFTNAWREHRTVVLPDFQGMGIGVRISDAIASHFVGSGCRYFSKTAHPRMGVYRESSPLWRATSKNRKDRQDYKVDRDTKEKKHKHHHIDRVCWSHEYVGLNNNSLTDCKDIQ